MAELKVGRCWLWTLNGGQPPTQLIIDQFRYLRQLGVPFEKSELGSGRGNRVQYRFDHLIESGVALYAIQHGMRPRDVSGYLIENRVPLRRFYREAFNNQPVGALNAEWVKSRGKQVPLLADELFLRLHDRFSLTPGRLDMLRSDELHVLAGFGSLVERFPAGEVRPLLPLTRLVLEIFAWALDAPTIKTGPK